MAWHLLYYCSSHLEAATTAAVSTLRFAKATREWMQRRGSLSPQPQRGMRKEHLRGLHRRKEHPIHLPSPDFTPGMSSVLRNVGELVLQSIRCNFFLIPVPLVCSSSGNSSSEMTWPSMSQQVYTHGEHLVARLPHG